ncbi:MAG: hypothetical protein M0Z90_03900, partial [Desulfobacteraceae bacterium]|nr:hypothetical protein [Desulfobacteraceae bacterium]
MRQKVSVFLGVLLLVMFSFRQAWAGDEALRRRAQAGDPKAQVALGEAYERGVGVGKDLAQ